MAGTRTKTATAKSAEVGTLKSVTIDEINKWQEAAKAHIAQGADEVPDGWYTVAEIADNVLKRSQRATRDALVKMGKSGTVESRTFKILCKDQVRDVSHYRLK